MIKIALDAGHGINTPGKQTPDGIKEWTLNDKVRDKVVDILSAYDVEIVNVDNNEGMVDESLQARVSAYVKAGVKAFVSIHHNAYTGTWNGATGVEVYTDNNATAEDTRLANLIYNKMVKYTGLRGRGVKKSNFTVINQNTIPAVLCEGGFMDGTNDYKVITSDKGQNDYATAVAEGLIEFLGLSKRTIPEPAPQPIHQPVVTSSNIKSGVVVKIANGAKYYNGTPVPSWVIGINWVVDSVTGDRAVINKSVDGKHSINSPINVSFLSVVNSSPTPTPTPVNNGPSFTEYKVKITASALNIRAGAGMNYGIKGTIRDRGVYTIIDEKSGWGKLKSGAGWIALSYCKKV